LHAHGHAYWGYATAHGATIFHYEFLCSHQQFHFLKASALRVGLPLGFFIGPFTPLILAQKLLRRLAAFDPGLSFEGLVVTAICNFEPGFSLR